MAEHEPGPDRERIVLGIETSCDETAAAVVARSGPGAGRILANVVRSQLAEHAPFGGVVPEIAARAHVGVLDRLIARALAEAGLALADLDAVAATAGPGLIGGLIVGLVTAKALALAVDRPLVAVNHLEAHALVPGLTEGLAPPYLLLLVSGGHTQLLIVHDVGRYQRLGTTLDDALGEAFDKTAKLLGLGFPGGPAVEARARRGDGRRFELPRPMLGRPEPDFSFAGLKTAARHQLRAIEWPNERDIDDLCASFQAAAVATVADRVGRAMAIAAPALAGQKQPTLVAAGGVAANGALRQGLQDLADRTGWRLSVPPPGLCTDNAAMVAWAGAERLARGLTDGLEAPARARWPLDEVSPARVGSGRLGVKV